MLFVAGGDCWFLCRVYMYVCEMYICIDRMRQVIILGHRGAQNVQSAHSTGGVAGKVCSLPVCSPRQCAARPCDPCDLYI